MNLNYLPTAPPVARLIEELHKLPGIGPKTAQRLAYHLLRSPKEYAQSLAEAIIAVKERVVLCSTCQNITEENPCLICRNEKRDRTQICVVEEALDILALEKAGSFKGIYHVLHGALSPLDGIGPEDLKIRELLERLKGDGVTELILATNPNLEGEATAMYLHRLLSPLGVRITRLARGLPMGSDLEYADEVTLARAFEGRQEFR
ncbi:MAG: recombination mediator RecR [Dehalococcoidia bacterium]|nr:recombination mediator RecR [Dehalococcoidia bacterium]